MHQSSVIAAFAVAFATSVTAHTAAWAPGMYCLGGNDTSTDNPNSNSAVSPLNDFEKEDWWFQHERGCDAVPPPAGEFLELPANGEFTVQLAHNRALTTLSYDGKFATDWPDGKEHPEDWNGGVSENGEEKCVDDGALHTTNQTGQSATAWAISYQSELSAVTMENLVVFSTLDHTPWKRIATYKVPDLQACPEAGCTCAWLWIPNGCGQLNMYMQGFKCKVTNASPTARPLAKAQVPTYCKDDPSKCVKGAKQMLAWHQRSGNNIETEGHTAPNYNYKCGWSEGAQTDIFEGAAPAPAPTPTPIQTTTRGIQPPTTLVTMVPSAVVAQQASTAAAVPSGTAPVRHLPPPWWLHWHRRPYHIPHIPNAGPHN